MPYPIVHIEFQVKDGDQAIQWYSDVFGWEMKKEKEYNYISFAGDNGSVGGGLNITDETPPGAVPYVSTDDIPELLKQVETKGGKILMSETELPGMGTLAMFTDPDGNTIGAVNFPDM